MRNLLFYFLFVTQLLNGQQYSVQEDKIYNAIDVFVSKPDTESLHQLEITEKGLNPKSKKEILAYVILKCNKAYYQNQFGFANQAIVSYEKAWQLFQIHKLSNYDIVDSCLQPLGNLYTSIGDYVNAENIIKSYYFNATIEKNSRQKYAAVLNLSNVFQTSGRLKEAIYLLQKTLQTEVLTSTQKGTILNNLGNAYFLSTKDLTMEREGYSKAEKSFLASVNLLKADPSQSKELSNVYRNLAVIYSESNQFDLANIFMEKAIKVFFLIPNGTPREQAKLYYENAKLCFQQNDIVNAEVSLKAIFSILVSNYSSTKNILPNKNTLYAETTLLDALDLQAEIYMSISKPQKALEAYQLSFHIESLLQSLLVYENSKIITQLRNRNRTEKCLDIYYSLNQKEKNIKYIESAFLLAEATKSTLLKEHLNHSKIISKQEKLIHSQLQHWNAIILKEQQKLDLANVALINKAIQKQNELMLMLKAIPFKNETKSTQVLTIPKLFSKLEKDNVIMVEYFFGVDRIYVFTLEQHKIKLDFIKVDGTTTQKTVQFIDLFSDANSIVNNPSQFNQYANSTYKLLKLPSKKTLKKLIIVPDGLLTFLPFEALITEKNNTTNFAKMHYLIYDFKVGYSNSALFYLELKPFQHIKESVLGVFPIFENSPLELAYSKKELESIKRNFDGLYLEKNKATFKNFKYNARNFSILHLSTHANSGDVYSPASILFYDKEIVYSELYDLNIKPDLIVLSACETGIGKLYKAEGAMSIARGFQFAGAQNLLFSLWKVNDYTTSLFMDDFYKNCKKSHSYFEANHQAKLDYLLDETIPNSKKSPYYWSAMVYYGTLESKSTAPSLLYIVIFLISCLGLFLIYNKTFKTSK